MSHGSHEPDVDESRLEPAGPWYQCLSSKQTLFALGQHAGSEPDVADNEAGPALRRARGSAFKSARAPSHRNCDLRES